MFKTDSNSSGNAFITKSETRDTIILSLATKSFIIHSLYVRIENTELHFGYLYSALFFCARTTASSRIAYSRHQTLIIRMCLRLTFSFEKNVLEKKNKKKLQRDKT